MGEPRGQNANQYIRSLCKVRVAGDYYARPNLGLDCTPHHPYYNIAGFQ
jgi:hypothetical protein